jgi:hypothetical protein
MGHYFSPTHIGSRSTLGRLWTGISMRSMRTSNLSFPISFGFRKVRLPHLPHLGHSNDLVPQKCQYLIPSFLSITTVVGSLCSQSRLYRLMVRWVSCSARIDAKFSPRIQQHVGRILLQTCRESLSGKMARES